MKSKYVYGMLGGIAVLRMAAVPWLSTGAEGDCHCDALYVTLLAATALGLYLVARGMNLRAAGEQQMNSLRRMGGRLLRIGYGIFGLVWGLATVVLLLGFVSSVLVTSILTQDATSNPQARAVLLWRTTLFGLGSFVGGLNAASLVWFALRGSTSPRGGKAAHSSAVNRSPQSG